MSAHPRAIRVGSWLASVVSVLGVASAASPLACTATASNFASIPSADGGVPSDAAADAKKAKDAGRNKAITKEEACSTWATAACAREMACGALRFQMNWGDPSTCEERKLVGCTERFDAPGASFTPEDLAACGDALEGTKCEAFSQNELPDECDFAGTRKKGQACADGVQCATGFCRLSIGSDCGQCAERGADYASCSTSSDCAAGYGCAGSRCVKLGGQGDYCGSGAPCVPWLTCQQGSCAKGSPAGTSCGGGYGGDATSCDAWSGVVCNALLMSCEVVNVKAAGAACDPFSDVCGAGAECSGGYGYGGGECVPPPREGDSCSTLGKTSCFAPSVCANGKCVIPDPAKCE